MGSGISQDGETQLTREQLTELSLPANVQFDETAFSIIAGQERACISVAKLKKYLFVVETPLVLNFTAVKGLFFVPVKGGRGPSIVEVKDAVEVSEGIIRALLLASVPVLMSDVY